MVRVGNLFEKIVSFENLHAAYIKAAKGKSKTQNLLHFSNNLEKELFELQALLISRRYKPKGYTSFYISDPKRRMISAAEFSDRVVHHALCNVIEPIFNKTMIESSFANRKGKGTHKAILLAQKYARNYAYVLKCDLRKYFSCILHDKLKVIIRRKIKCENTLWLIDQIIDNSNKQEDVTTYFVGNTEYSSFSTSRGLPLGNLTSQLFGNIYLNGFDHFMKDRLGIKGYIRYVDDFICFAENKSLLNQLKRQMTLFLFSYGLILHPDKSQIIPVEKGFKFLGYTVYRNKLVLLKPKVRRYFRLIRKRVNLLKKGLVSPQTFENQLNAWLGNLRFSKQTLKESDLFRYVRNQGVNLVIHPSGSWRVLEQQYRKQPAFGSEREQR